MLVTIRHRFLSATEAAFWEIVTKISRLWVKWVTKKHLGVSRKKGKVRVRGKVNLAVSRKRSVVEQNGIKISILWVQRSIEESFVGTPKRKDKVRGKVKKREISYRD